ncbi:hypothetical protein [Flagellimonas sp.]|uniref:hypothetical protein n=1 Tax=Flagellimonas sp. TaxID=2058762 RepID=UPI003BAC17B3
MKLDIGLMKVYLGAALSGAAWLSHINDVVQIVLAVLVIILTVLKIKKICSKDGE